MIESYRAGGAKQRNERSLDHILVDTNTPHLLVAASCCALNVCGGLHVTTATNRVLLVVADIEIDTEGGQRSSQG